MLDEWEIIRGGGDSLDKCADDFIWFIVLILRTLAAYIDRDP